MPVERTFSAKTEHPKGIGHRGGDRHSSEVAERTPEIEEQESPRRLGDGKGLNHDEFADDAHYAGIFHPHAPHENPAGHYGVVDGAGVDNTRPNPGRAQAAGRRPHMRRHEQEVARHGKRDEASGRNKSDVMVTLKGRAKRGGKGKSHMDY